MNAELTWDKDVDAVVTTPQSQWTAYQIAVANLNPELKQRNKRYQSALNTLNILNNEKVNLSEAGNIMMNAYKEAMNKTEDAAQNQMLANSVNANIQAWWAISWLAWLATNPWAAAQTRIAAQNQAAAQNAQVRSNADQNIGNLYSNAAQVPATLASMSATNAQIDNNQETLELQKEQAEANNNLANAQANYYNNQANTTTTQSTTTESPSIDYSKAEWKSFKYNWQGWYKVNKNSEWVSYWVDSDWNIVSDASIINALDNAVKKL